MATGTITISGQILNPPSGTKTIGGITISLPAAIESIIVPNLQIGNAGPFNRPDGATVLLVTFPSTSISTVVLQGADNTDTGLPIAGNGTSLITLGSAATAINLVIGAAPMPSGVEIAWF